MAALSRGKQALKRSISKTGACGPPITSGGPSKISRRRTSPDSDAEYWCETGLDKDGLSKRFISKYIGSGVFATKSFVKGDFLLEYCGTRKTEDDLKSKDLDQTFLFGFIYNNKSWWIDGSESNRLGKYVNDAENGTDMCNSKMKLKIFKRYPRLCLFATRDICEGEELRYDYGDDPVKLFWRHQTVDKQISVEEEDDDPFDLAGDDDEDEKEEEKKDQYDMNDRADASFGLGHERQWCRVDLDDLTFTGLRRDKRKLFTARALDQPQIDNMTPNSAELCCTNQPKTVVEKSKEYVVEKEKVGDLGPATEVPASSTHAMVNGPTDREGYQVRARVGVRNHSKPTQPIIAEYQPVPARALDQPQIDNMTTNSAELCCTNQPKTVVEKSKEYVVEKEKVGDLGPATEVPASSTHAMVNGPTDREGYQVRARVGVRNHSKPTQPIIAEYQPVPARALDQPQIDNMTPNSAELGCTNQPKTVVEKSKEYVVEKEKVGDLGPATEVPASSTHAMVNGPTDREGYQVRARVGVRNHSKPTQPIIAEYQPVPARALDQPQIDNMTPNSAELCCTNQPKTVVEKSKEYVVEKEKVGDLGPATEVPASSTHAMVNGPTDREGYQVRARVGVRNHSKPTQPIIAEYQPGFDEDETVEDEDLDPDYKPDENDEEDSDDDDDDDDDNASAQDSREEDGCNDIKRVSDSNDSDDGNSVIYPPMNLKTLHFQAIKNEKGKTTNKIHACLFCEKQLPNIARHYETVHSSEISVAKILVHPKKSKERRHMWEELVNKGDYAHNFEVAEKGHGLLIPKRRVEANNYNDLIPCMYCKALYKKTELWNHSNYCILKGENKIKNPVKNGRLLLPMPKCDTTLQINVLNDMRDDKIKEIIKNDTRILCYGKRLYDKHGKEPHKIHYISQKLRELGRLIAEVKTISTDIKGVDDLLLGKNWDTLIEGVRRVAGYDNETGQYLTPSLALKIGHSLQKCARYLRSEGNKEENEEKEKIGDRFLKTYESDWNDSISHHALESLGNRKYNKPLLLPLVEDVVKLNSYLRKEITDTTNSMKDNYDTTKYSRLSQMCLALIILFNRRRSGETERMTVKSFHDAIQKDRAPDDVVVGSLTPFEQKLCKSHTRIEIKGKRGRKVALLLTEEMKASLCCLITNRENAKVTKDLVFAKPGETKFPYRGSDCLRKFSLEAQVKDPHALTSTKLRKQLATLCQILNLSETSQDILATFQGHDIRIHREYYRLPQDTLEIAKVSKVLHSINNGDVAKYKGKDFDEIQIADKEAVDSESASECSDSENSDESDTYTGTDVTEEGKKDFNKISKTSASVSLKRHTWSSQEKDAIEKTVKRLHTPRKNSRTIALPQCY